MRDGIPRVNNCADARVEPQPRPQNPPADHPVEAVDQLLVLRRALYPVGQHDQRGALEHQHAQNRHGGGVDQHSHDRNHPSPCRAKQTQDSLADRGQHQQKHWHIKSMPRRGKLQMRRPRAKDQLLIVRQRDPPNRHRRPHDQAHERVPATDRQHRSKFRRWVIPGLRKFLPDEIENGENDSETNNLRQNRNDKSVQRNRGMNDQRHDDHGRDRERQVERQHDQIHRKEFRADQLPSQREAAAILSVTPRDRHWVTVLLEKSHHFFVGKRVAKLRLLLFHLRAEFGGEFFDNVVALRSRQTPLHGTQITFEDFHHALLKNPIQRGIHVLPLRDQLFENDLAVFRKPVKPLVALVFFAPLADQQALRLEAPQQRVEGAFIDGHAVVGEGFAEGVAVLLGLKGGQDSEDQ